ncbi:MAG: hypothetical protein V1685_06100, partial [Parcubacteria group bacterium]
DNNLTVDQRLTLFAEVTRRFTEGRNLYQSEYVESINNPDAIENLNIKVSEYWAEICAAYFTEPEKMKSNNPEDFALVDRWVKLQDPGYDTVVQAEARQRLSAEYSEEYAKQQQQERYTALPEEVRRELDALPEQFACELERKSFFEGSSGYDPMEVVQEVFTRHGIQQEPDWQIAIQVSIRISEAVRENQDVWKRQFENEMLQSLSPEVRDELYAYLGHIQTEFTKTAGSDKDTFDWDSFDREMVKGLDAFREKCKVQCSTQALHDWVFSHL